MTHTTDHRGTTATVTLDRGRVLQGDFLGIGVNVIPTNLMPASRAHGYTDAHWELDRRRILAARPRVARMWFQVDWFERTPGVYDPTLREFADFCAYLDVFREAGTRVELNLGWKAGSAIQDWFSVEGCNPVISAPRDLDVFAATCSALLIELIDVRGYDNLAFLTFYNEPNGWWDFDAPGDDMDYYARMVEAVDARLRRDGLRDRIEIWGPEESGAPEWTAGIAERVDDCIDMYSFHVYGVDYLALPEQISARTEVVEKPVGLTEFGWGRDETSGWTSGYAATVVRAAEAGLRTCLVWQLHGAYVTDPAIDTNGDFTMWDSPLFGPGVKHAFLSAGTLMRLLPPGRIIAAEVDRDDVRSAAFQGHDGALAVLVEHRSAGSVRVDLTDPSIEQVWAVRYVRDLVGPELATSTLPGVSRVLGVHGGVFVDDELPGEGFTVYSTTPPAPQVVIDSPVVTVTAGSDVPLSARAVDAAGPLTWRVLTHGAGVIDDEAVFRPDAVTEPLIVAVEASLRDAPCISSVALVQVVPAAAPDAIEAPRLTAESGAYRHPVRVGVAWSAAGAVVRYTRDLTTPTIEAPILSEFVVEPGSGVHVKAAAFTEDGRRSGIVDLIVSSLAEPIA